MQCYYSANKKMRRSNKTTSKIKIKSTFEAYPITNRLSAAFRRTKQRTASVLSVLQTPSVSWFIWIQLVCIQCWHRSQNMLLSIFLHSLMQTAVFLATDSYNQLIFNRPTAFTMTSDDQSIQSFHGGLLSSTSSYHCWSSWHSGGNGWSAPIAGYFTEEPKKNQQVEHCYYIPSWA